MWLRHSMQCVTMTIGMASLSTSWVAAAAPAPLPGLNELRSHRPDLLVPGSTRPVFDVEPPGYVVCTLVTRYFDDETLADLEVELDLEARKQFVRYLVVGRDDVDTGRAQVTVSRFQNVARWWDGPSLHGLYFVPVDGVEQAGVEAIGGAAGGIEDPSAAELLLEGRTLRKNRKFDMARDVFTRLRQKFPLSPEARRALREIYFVNTAEKRPSAGAQKSP